MKKIKFYEHPSYIGCANELPKSDKRIPIFKEQFEKDGFDDSCTWSLDYSIVKFILPRLKRYYELADEVIKIDAHEGFREAIEVMIEGFEIFLTKNFPTKEENEKIQLAYDMLAKYHRGLWW